MPPRRHLGRARSQMGSFRSQQLIDDLSCSRRFIQDLDGALCVQETEVRKKSEQAPIGAYRRRKLYWCSLFKKQEKNEDPQSLDDNENSCNQTYFHPRKQYCVSNVSRKKRTLKEFLFDSLDTHQIEYEVSRLYCDYVNWTYTANPMYLFLSFLIFFVILLFLFSTLILIAGKMRPSCITVSGESFDKSMSSLGDAFSLSWSTFTTVGYGMVYPATSIEESNQESCTGVIFLLTTESLVGLLYAGMCAALLFGKIVRIQSHAQVEFSNALCVKYQVEGREKKLSRDRVDIPENSSLEELETNENKVDKRLSQENIVCGCPTLSFQIVNQNGNKNKGTIMDATIKAIGSHSLSDTKRKFTRVELVEAEHPLFKQVWIVSHVLNQYSTLLKPKVREVIADNNGSWPIDWCNPKRIRHNLNFNELTITISGVSNITACSVYNCKTYKYTDLLIGYEFAPVLYKKEGTDSLKVDMSLINDVAVQRFNETDTTDDKSENQMLDHIDDFNSFISNRNSINNSK